VCFAVRYVTLRFIRLEYCIIIMADEAVKELLRKNRNLPARKSEKRGITTPGQQVKDNIIRRSFNRMSARRGDAVKPSPVPVTATGPKPQPMTMGGKAPAPVDLSRRGSKSSVGGVTERSHSVAGSLGGTREFIIRSGMLSKKGVINTSWKKRFFILTNKTLYYYPDDFNVPDDIDFHLIDAPPRGKVDVSLIIGVEREPKGAKEKFMVKTPVRGYRLKTEKIKDAEAWIAAITGAADHMKSREHQVGMRRASVSSLKADELDELDTDTAAPDPTNIAGARSTSTHIVGPHTPAAVDNYINWGRFDVAAWLHTLSLGQKYSELFYQNNIDGKVLEDCVKDKGKLIEIGVDKEDVTAILTGIRKLQDIYDGNGEL